MALSAKASISAPIRLVPEMPTVVPKATRPCGWRGVVSFISHFISIRSFHVL